MTLVDSHENHEREVEVSVGEVIKIKDGPRSIYISLDRDDGRLRVEMVDEEQNLIITEENNQPKYDNVNAFLGPNE
ncbi:hypothetical protein [Salinibacter ruber]|uniref:hypothetical protein n=1 Tax=Salinibacter ruber TaxID=146919 RepID=UPI002169EC9F|nr:hypothetical protein [Salinibacter ruber]